MKIKILYVAWDKTDRDQRDDASRGTVLPPECYTQADERELSIPNDLTAEKVCDFLYQKYQAVDGPVTNANGKGIRSMSTGDLVDLDGKRFVCINLIPEACPNC